MHSRQIKLGKGHQTAERQVLISPIHHHRYLQYISRDSLFSWHTFVAPCAIERFPPLHYTVFRGRFEQTTMCHHRGATVVCWYS